MCVAWQRVPPRRAPGAEGDDAIFDASEVPQSWGDDFTIQDEPGQDVFFVDGKAFSLGEPALVPGHAGQRTGVHPPEVARLGPDLRDYSRGSSGRSSRRRCSPSSTAPSAWTCPAPTTWRPGATSPTTSTQFERGGDTVATVSKRWFSWTDTYGVEIAEGEDDILILASTVVIDMACHEEHDE